jgi:hypothetical protein
MRKQETVSGKFVVSWRLFEGESLAKIELELTIFKKLPRLIGIV